MVQVFIVWLMMMLVVSGVHGGTETQLRALLNAKLNNSDYSPKVRPIQDTGSVLTLTVDMYLVALNDVDDVEQKISTTAYMKIVWPDTFMTWNVSEYGDIAQFTLPQDEIWKPDLALANAYDTIKGLGDSFMYLTLTYDGNITWEPYQVFESTCDLDMTYFPFDSQTCALQLVTWSSTAKMIQIIAGNDGFNTDAFEENANWYLLSATTVNSTTESTSGLSFSLQIKRKPIFFLINFMIPIVLLSFLNNFVFILPCASGEKTGYAVVLFLSFAIFLLIVTDIMPEGMNTVPVLSIYLIFECILSTFIVFLSIIQVRVHSQDEKEPVPHYLDKFTKFTQKVKRKVCFEKQKDDSSDDEDEENEAKKSITSEKLKNHQITPTKDGKFTSANVNAAHDGNKKKAKTAEDSESGQEKRSFTNSLKQKLCCGADTSTVQNLPSEHESSDTNIELKTVSPKTSFRLVDILGNSNRVTPDLFFSKPMSVDPIYGTELNVEEMEDIEDILASSQHPKMANVQMGLRQNSFLSGYKPAKTPEPVDTDSESTSSSSSDGEAKDGTSWTDVALAMDNMFFVVFFIINSFATIVAFSICGIN